MKRSRYSDIPGDCKMSARDYGDGIPTGDGIISKIFPSRIKPMKLATIKIDIEFVARFLVLPFRRHLVPERY
jgi:hypothetical protein